MNCARLPCTDAISEQLVRERKKKKKNRLFAFQGCKCVIAGRDSFRGCTKCLTANGCVRARVLLYSVLTLAPAGFKAEAVIQTDSSQGEGFTMLCRDVRREF